jgi:hypothetical protein
MTNQELFSQAIADAKAVRDAAVANAKAALEETFTPKIMSMLSAKLNEMEEDLEERVQGSKENIKAGVKVHPHGQPERVMTVISPDGGFNGKVQVEDEKGNKASFEAEDLDLVETQEEGHEATIGFGAASQKPQIEGEEVEEGSSIEEAELDEILAQLEAEEKGTQEEGKEEVEEAKEEVEEAKKKDDDKKKVEESLEEADDESDDTEDDESDGDDEMTELTVDELKDIIRDVLKDVLAGEETAGEESGEELDLTAMGDEAGADEEETEDDSISLEELLAELDKEDAKKVEEAKEEVEEGKEEMEEGKKKEVEEAKKDKKDLEEAIKTIKTLQVELNEVNLLNAKLLYTNKIFKSKSLNEAQKVKVLKSLDKAANVKEAKAIFETLSENLNSKPAKSSIKESVGFASKAVGVAPTQPIVEGDSAIRRMQQLAGIIK